MPSVTCHSSGRRTRPCRPGHQSRPLQASWVSTHTLVWSPQNAGLKAIVLTLFLVFIYCADAIHVCPEVKYGVGF